MSRYTPPKKVQEQPLAGIPYSPVPTAVAVGIAESISSGGKHVVLQVSTPLGIAVYFLDAEAAESIGNEIVEQSKLARSSLDLSKA